MPAYITYPSESEQMMIIKRISIVTISIFGFYIAILIGFLFSPGGKKIVPLRPLTEVNIQDGEYLYYKFYANRKYTMDYYTVIKKIRNSEGKLLYRCYEENRFAGDKPEEDYTKWTIRNDIDPQIGSIVEGEAHYTPYDWKVFKDGWDMEGLLSWHYKLYPDKGYVEYTENWNINNKLKVKKSIIKVPTGYSVWNYWATGVYIRLYSQPSKPDSKQNNTIYWVMPEFVKAALPFSSVYPSNFKNNDLTTPPNNLKCLQYKTSNPFLGVLTNLMVNFYVYLNDSNFPAIFTIAPKSKPIRNLIFEKKSQIN